jgi:putative ABC transport system substrate-binding protein
VGWPAPAEAQPAAKVARVGFLSAGTSAALATRVEAFRQGLKELGYIEGKNIVIEYRYADVKVDRLPALAADLERSKLDVIVTAGPVATRAAKQATSIPIVMAFDSDPVGSGFVASLARPGGNITGLSILAPELSGKQLDILKQIVPKLSRVAVLGDSNEPANRRSLQETERAAAALGLQVLYHDIRASNDLEDIFRVLRKGNVDALVVLVTPTARAPLVALAAKSRLPAMYWQPHFVEAGGLMTYSVRLEDLFRRAAAYVDKILKGAKPAELPVELAHRFDLMINLKAAKEIGLDIPMSVLARADRVIH